MFAGCLQSVKKCYDPPNGYRLQVWCRHLSDSVALAVSVPLLTSFRVSIIKDGTELQSSKRLYYCTNWGWVGGGGEGGQLVAWSPSK